MARVWGRTASLAWTAALAISTPALPGCGDDIADDQGSCSARATSITPGTGLARGGGTVEIDGSCFDEVTAVSFDRSPADIVERSATRLTVRVPVRLAGTVDIIAQRENGQRFSLGVEYTFTALTPKFATMLGAIPAEVVDVRDAAAADFDGDGDVDVLLAVRLAASIYLQNDGGGLFSDVSATKLTAPVLDAIGVAAADVDGDGDVDAFLSSIDVAQTDVLLRNDGAGNLVADAAAVLGDGSADHAVVFGDVDGDEDQDLVSATWIGADRVLLNDGAGIFAPKADAMPAREEATPGVSLADLDDDGNLDVVFGVQAGGAPIRILYGIGDGTFTDAPANTVGDGVLGALRRPAVGDLDGDGRLDIAAGGAGSYDVLLQSSEGRFLWSNSVLDLVSEAGTWNAAEVADLDLDGDGDLVFAGEGVSMRFFENTATGFIARHDRVPAAVRVTRDVVVADFTGDGAPDLLVTEGLEAQTELLASDGE